MLVTMTAPPLPGQDLTLGLEEHRDAVLVEAPELLAQAVGELLRPLAAQEVDDRVPALEELVAVAPGGVRGVRGGDPLGVAGVPGVLGRLHLRARRLLAERGDGWAWIHPLLPARTRHRGG